LTKVFDEYVGIDYQTYIDTQAKLNEYQWHEIFQSTGVNDSANFPFLQDISIVYSFGCLFTGLGMISK
jgi:hypothetical protein